MQKSTEVAARAVGQCKARDGGSAKKVPFALEQEVSVRLVTTRNTFILEEEDQTSNVQKTNLTSNLPYQTELENTIQIPNNPNGDQPNTNTKEKKIEPVEIKNQNPRSPEAVEEGEGDEEEEPKTQTPQPKSLPRNEEENGSNSEPDSDSSPSQFKLQHISKQPATSAKRALQGDCNNEDSSRSEKKLKTVEKKSAPTSVSATSRGVGFITRLWTEEDEIALLKGMINFKSQKGVDPYADMGVFFYYIKQKLQVIFFRAQMSSKISRMKKRFLNALEKGENGEDPIFSKPHDCKAFDLSKKLWGAAVEKSKGSNMNTNRVVENVKKDKGKLEISSEDDKQQNRTFSLFSSPISPSTLSPRTTAALTITVSSEV
ncbi:STOREKEEPER protein-like [Olea europaea var. sylvestris]|uniref:STOREKEEPER protein-like n=1 Tax=Olea europaea var. sylvestris TaxID=158386 RepID=UPI000C1CCD0C|nr:STOREKEEPER protein-like [Olea europaea var. sylvestris]